MKKDKMTRICKQPTSVGDTIQASGYNWIAVHEDADNWVLTTDVCVAKCTFFDLAQTAKKFEDSLDPDFLDELVPTTVHVDPLEEDITSKVFVPTIQNVDYDLAANHGEWPHTSRDGTEWPWFNSNEHRKYETYWWTVSMSTHISLFIIDPDGRVLSGIAVFDQYGFRPFVKMRKG